MEQSIDEILSNSTSQEIAVETPTQEVEQPIAQTTPQVEQTLPTEANADVGKEKGWEYHAYKDEKEKRKQLEQQLALASRQLEQFQSTQKQEPVDMFADPDGFVNGIKQQYSELKQALTLQQSEFRAVTKYGVDVVKEAEAAFYNVAINNEALRNAALNSGHPHDFVVEWHRNQKTLQEVGSDIGSYRDKLKSEIEAETRAKVMAELESKGIILRQQDIQSTLPTDLSSTRSIGERAPIYTGQTPLSDLIGGKKR
jgi:hypothetical protein